MIGLVIVSHSKMLADGLHQLAQQMQNNTFCRIQIAAGVDDPENPLGTDAIKIMEAIESLSDTQHIILLMDLGSAILSAETALELIEPSLAQKTYLCSAPLVEGAIAITVAASSGADLNNILYEADHALSAKQTQLGHQTESHTSEVQQIPIDANAIHTQCTLINPNGLHARPAAKLASTLAPFNAELSLEKNHQRINPKSMSQIALLQVRQGDNIRLFASGIEAEAAIAAFDQLAATHFGENINNNHSTTFYGQKTIEPTIFGYAYQWKRPQLTSLNKLETIKDCSDEKQKIGLALKQTIENLTQTIENVKNKFGGHIADIFDGHILLLSDDEIIQALDQCIESKQCSAQIAIEQVFSELKDQYQQITDPYLNARKLDIDDLKYQMLFNLTQKNISPTTFDKASILLSDELHPFEIIKLNPANIAAIALSKGSPYSHSAIIARKMGIPMLVNLGEEILSIADDSRLAVDPINLTLSIEN